MIVKNKEEGSIQPKSDLKWKTVVVDVSKLKLLKNNPRTITEKNFERLKRDINDVGNFRPIICDIDMTVIGGNQRSRILSLREDKTIEVSIPNRKLTDKERKKVILLDNKHRGEDDVDLLANEYEDELKELDLGFVDDVDWAEHFEEKADEIDIVMGIYKIRLAFPIEYKEKIENIIKKYGGEKNEAFRKIIEEIDSKAREDKEG